MRSRGIVGTIGVLMVCASLGSAAESAKLAPLRFLLGEWEAIKSGKPGEASGGTATFTASLQGYIIMRNSFAEYPSGDGRPAVRHGDLSCIPNSSDRVSQVSMW